MDSKAKSSKQIIKLIGCSHLSLVRCVGEAYWYFVFDLPEHNIYETESVYTPRLNDMTVDQWVDIGKSFVDEVMNKYK